MNLRKITLFFILIFLLALVGAFYLYRSTIETKLDPVQVNDIVRSVEEQWQDLGSSDLPCLQYRLEYVVIDHSGKLVKATRRGLNESINTAISNRDTILNITVKNKIVGNVIIYNDIGRRWDSYRDRLFILSTGMLLFVILFFALYAAFIDRKILMPFRKLREFAINVAGGNFNIPLKMDRANQFGAFTESFDLLRDELAQSKLNEERANQSKKELVAGLSHDIKTPVSSIKAVSELMAVKTKDEWQLSQLQIIDKKADQFNELITNMFNATLEELQELSVNIGAHPSSILNELIKQADYLNLVQTFEIPECTISADKLRLSQIIDNIVTNSYKYAGTNIEIDSKIEDNYLRVDFTDHGTGVSEEEVWRLFHKYFRATNAKGKSGAGLGLFISKYLINKMDGTISCENIDSGFRVSINLRII